MKKIVLLTSLALVGGAILLRYLQQDPGYLLISAFGKTIEMRLGFAVFMLLLSLLVLFVLYRLLRGLLRGLTHGWHEAWTWRGRRAERKTQEGLMQFFSGNWSAAEKQLLRGARANQTPALNYLAAAQSACAMGDMQRARAHLDRAEKSGEIDPDDLALPLVRIRIAMGEGNYELACAILHQCKTHHPDHPVLLDLLQQTYVGMGDWAAVEPLLLDLQKRRILGPERWQSLALQVYTQLLEALQQRAATGEELEAVAAEQQQLWHRAPKLVRQDSHFVLKYAELLADTGQIAAAADCVNKALKSHWSPQLVELYSRLPLEDRGRQLQQIQHWEAEHPDDAMVELALGRVAMHNDMPGPARDHLVRSIELQPSPAAFAELGGLLAQIGDQSESSQVLQRGLLLSSQQTAT